MSLSVAPEELANDRRARGDLSQLPVFGHVPGRRLGLQHVLAGGAEAVAIGKRGKPSAVKLAVHFEDER